MPELSTTRRVRHAAAEMFDLVADVEHYPEFVPLCRLLTVRERKKESGKDIIIADMTVAYKLVRRQEQAGVHPKGADQLTAPAAPDRIEEQTR
jgi:ribosome-associated toxin RatA of RatAB toxin-antitoxin module